jgi:hypothetical protein
MSRALSLAALGLLLLAGCGPSKSAIEASIRDEMKKSMNVDIATIDLAKQPDGGYTGTAVAANGDAYDVQVQPAQGNRAEWKALPSLPVLEKQIKMQIGAQVGSQVQSLTLTKNGFGSYTGTAVLANGQRMNVRTFLEGRQIRFEATPN